MAKHRAHAPDRRGRTLRLGPRRGEGAPHPGRGRPSSSWLPEPLGRGRHKMRAHPRPHFCGTPENWNRTQHRACSIQSSREPEQRRRGEQRPASLQRDGTSEPEPETTSAPVSGRKLGTEETGKQTPNKQREPLQKGPCNRLKSL